MRERFWKFVVAAGFFFAAGYGIWSLAGEFR